MAISPDGRRLASASWGPGQVKVWEIPTGKELYTRQLQSAEVQSVAFSPDGKRVAAVVTSAVAKPVVKLWDAATGHELPSLDIDRSLFDHVSDLRGAEVRFNRDGKRLFLFAEGAYPGGLLTVWDGQRPADSR
jgi:WD40 repeat protein